MGRALFGAADFLAAARDLAVERGPALVTVGAVAERLKAPTGSFYHRFASRDVLLGELWLATALDFQRGFVAAIERGDGLAAALHTPVWMRAHLDEACLLLLYHRNDFVQGAWPAALERGVAEQARRFDACCGRFARETFGRADGERMRLAQFVLAEVPIAAVRPHLRRRERPPPLVDELIATTYHAVLASRETAGAGKKRRLR